MNFDPMLGVVLIESSSTRDRQVFNAHQVKEVYYYDERKNVNRRFLALCGNSPGHHDDTFYEVVLQGEAFLLRRQKLRTRHPKEAADYDYYTLFRDELFSLRRFSRVVYPAMADELTSLEEFKRNNLLYPANVIDAIQLVEYYNRSIKSAGALAMH